MKYKLTMRVKDYQLVGEKYQNVEAKQNFIFQNDSQLAAVVSSLARSTEEELTITIEKIEEEEPNE